ncbi:MAG: saccharopine dehydrogenase [Robiginitomaculum sp.]|nr:MAG: saccharopine dehydrogenase [Robiginitomaculum sp.]
MSILIYGATGFTGRLCAHEAAKRKLPVVLAGRNAKKLQKIGADTGLETRTFDLADTEALEHALADISVVLHIAGPFSATAQSMVSACLRTNTHYLDITGEIGVFEAHAALDGAAKKAKIMILSGVGFDVVPSDCLAAYVHQKLPDATELTLGITGISAMTRGTAKSGVEGIRFGTRVRRNGKIVELYQPQLTELDFGQGLRPAVGMSWGDVATAWHSTGIANISVFFEASPQFERVAKLGKFARKFLGTRLMQGVLKRQMDKIPEGPTEAQMRDGQMTVIAIASNAAGKTVRARLQTPEAYSFTAKMAIDIAQRVVDGAAQPGYQTPSLVFGADYVTGFDRVSRMDITDA